MTRAECYCAAREQSGRTLDDTVNVQSVKRILRDKDLDSTQCRKDVCVVIWMCTKATWIGIRLEQKRGEGTN